MNILVPYSISIVQSFHYFSLLTDLSNLMILSSSISLVAIFTFSVLIVSSILVVLLNFRVLMALSGIDQLLYFQRADLMNRYYQEFASFILIPWAVSSHSKKIGCGGSGDIALLCCPYRTLPSKPHGPQSGPARVLQGGATDPK